MYCQKKERSKREKNEKELPVSRKYPELKIGPFQMNSAMASLCVILFSTIDGTFVAKNDARNVSHLTFCGGLPVYNNSILFLWLLLPLQLRLFSRDEIVLRHNNLLKMIFFHYHRSQSFKGIYHNIVLPVAGFMLLFLEDDTS